MNSIVIYDHDDDYHKPSAFSHDVALCDNLDRGPIIWRTYTDMSAPSLPSYRIGATYQKLHVYTRELAHARGRKTVFYRATYSLWNVDSFTL